MKLVACTIRGKLKWRLDARVNGKGPRPTFDTHAAAVKALADARKQRSAFGKAFDVLPALEKSRVMAMLQEIKLAGLTLDNVLSTVKASPAAPSPGCTLKDALAGCLTEAGANNCRPRHIGNLKWYLSHFIKGRESMDARSIGMPELEQWFADRNEAPRSKNGHISLLSIMFDYCWRKRFIPENPVKRLKRPKIDRGTPPALTRLQQIKSLLWARRRKPNLLAWLVLTQLVGMRPEAEADVIDWGMIDLKRGRIKIDRSKIRHVPHRIIDLTLCPPALAWLRVAKKIKSPLPLTHVTRRRYVRLLRDYLKIKRWPQDILRHTAASNLIAFHQDAGKVAEFMGTSAGVLLRDYKALVYKEDAENAMKLLPKKRHFKKGKNKSSVN